MAVRFSIQAQSRAKKTYKPLKILALILIAGLGTHCGGSGKKQAIGEICLSYTECDGIQNRAACITEWEDGYCTELSCSLGSCPSGSRCVRGISFENVYIDAFCLKVCETNDDCRSAYMCTDVGQSSSVCTPR